MQLASNVLQIKPSITIFIWIGIITITRFIWIGSMVTNYYTWNYTCIWQAQNEDYFPWCTFSVIYKKKGILVVWHLKRSLANELLPYSSTFFINLWELLSYSICFNFNSHSNKVFHIEIESNLQWLTLKSLQLLSVLQHSVNSIINTKNVNILPMREKK